MVVTWEEMNKNRQEAFNKRANRKKPADVLDKVLKITGIEYEDIPNTDDKILVIKTENYGEISTGSGVLKKQAREIKKYTDKGEVVEAKIVQMQGKGYRRFYSFA